MPSTWSTAATVTETVAPARSRHGSGFGWRRPGIPVTAPDVVARRACGCPFRAGRQGGHARAISPAGHLAGPPSTSDPRPSQRTILRGTVSETRSAEGGPPEAAGARTPGRRRDRTPGPRTQAEEGRSGAAPAARRRWTRHWPSVAVPLSYGTRRGRPLRQRAAISGCRAHRQQSRRHAAHLVPGLDGARADPWPGAALLPCAQRARRHQPGVEHRHAAAGHRRGSDHAPVGTGRRLQRAGLHRRGDDGVGHVRGGHALHRPAAGELGRRPGAGAVTLHDRPVDGPPRPRLHGLRAARRRAQRCHPAASGPALVADRRRSRAVHRGAALHLPGDGCRGGGRRGRRGGGAGTAPPAG